LKARAGEVEAQQVVIEDLKREVEEEKAKRKEAEEESLKSRTAERNYKMNLYRVLLKKISHEECVYGDDFEELIGSEF